MPALLAHPAGSRAAARPEPLCALRIRGARLKAQDENGAGRGSLAGPSPALYEPPVMSCTALIRSMLLVSIVVLAIDQLSKWYVLEVLDLPHRLDVAVLPPFLNFRMAWNTGINFGLFGGGPRATRGVMIGSTLGRSGARSWCVLRGGQQAR